MKLLQMDEIHCDLAAMWLTDEHNRRFLDFGNAEISTLMLRVMCRKPAHALRMFTADDAAEPVGIVALSDIHSRFRTAQVWYTLGDKRYVGRGLTRRAVSLLLEEGFGRLGLQAVHAWTVEHNTASIRVLVSNGFRQCGHVRNAHVIDGRSCDRLLFDILREEFYGTR